MKMPLILRDRLQMMGQDPDKIYSTKTRKACLDGKESVPWMKGFYFIEKDVDKDDKKNEWIQDPASFVPVIALDPHPGDEILDMAAAPGMKTVLISRLMENKGKITACEIDLKRILRLRSNLRKFDCIICKAVRCDASRFKTEEKFDRILLDAPCSGEGMVTKQDKVFKIWSEKRIMRMQKMQKKLIKRGVELLKDNGILVYSTCTFSPEENEEVVEWLISGSGAVPLDIDIEKLNHSSGIGEWQGNFFPDHEKFIRIWPYQNNTNGMFVAKLRK